MVLVTCYITTGALLRPPGSICVPFQVIDYNLE